MQHQSNITVWDPFVRVFHWSLALSYLVAWASAEEIEWLHERDGYFLMGLIGLRLIWAIVGTRHARFSDFVVGPRAALDYLRSLRSGHPKHYLGHNPAGGWMVLALLFTLTLCGVSGLMMSGENDLLEEVHEGLANLSLLLVGLHVAGVAISSRVHRENLVLSMLTGKKNPESVNAPD